MVLRNSKLWGIKMHNQFLLRLKTTKIICGGSYDVINVIEKLANEI